MPDWILVPCLVQLRTEFNTIAPARDKASDGTIGDPAHAEHVSDHNPDESGKVPIRDADRLNEVHALDIDKDLRTPGLNMEKVVQFILSRCRAGQERRLRYIIFNRRIWEASNRWRERTYRGPNAHDQHAHFSSSYETAKEADTSSWHLSDLIKKPEPPKENNVAITTDEIKAIGTEVWTRDVSPGGGDNKAWTTLWATHQDSRKAVTELESLRTEVGSLREKVTELETTLAGKLEEVLAKLNEQPAEEEPVPPPTDGE